MLVLQNIAIGVDSRTPRVKGSSQQSKPGIFACSAISRFIDYFAA
jgi:hypothetical protein